MFRMGGKNDMEAKRPLILTVIGGGSSYTPELIDGIIIRSEELAVAEIRLVDIENGREKLEIIEALSKRMVENAGLDCRISATLDRREALKGADFVLTQLRVGGLEARSRDESIPLRHGAIGQETTGAGGMAKALRTIPVILGICKDMEELCPDAWLINFTNPAGMVTEAVLKHTRIKAIGLCNVPLHMRHNVAKLLDVPVEKIDIDQMGLNHLVWGTAVRLDGKDVLETVLERMATETGQTMKNIPDLKWDAALLKQLGAIPCPYHRYFYLRDDMLAEELESAASGKGSRALQVMAIEKELFEKYKSPDLKTKPKELENRGGAYYSDAAISLISAIHNDKQEIHTVNIINQGAIANLPDDAVVEIKALIGQSGAKAIVVGEMPVQFVGLAQQVKAYERLTIRAVVNDNPGDAIIALVNHPLVGDAHKAEAIVKDIYLENFGRHI